MKKNVANQSVGCQMITTASGANFIGTVSVAVTVDNGAQTAGAGAAPVHEGGGYYSYSPAQAETNGDHLAFTFSGGGALSHTVQTFTGFPQTADNEIRLAAIPTTPMRGTDGANTVTPPTESEINDEIVAGVLGSNTTNILADTDELQTNQGNWVTATGFSTLTEADIRTAIGMSAANLDAQMDAIAAAVRTELATELARMDVAVSSRLADSGYTAPDNATIIDISNAITARLIGTILAGNHPAQSGDSYARLGAPTGADIAEDISNVTAPTVEEIDAELTAEHGAGSWASGGGLSPEAIEKIEEADQLVTVELVDPPEGPAVVIPDPSPDVSLCTVFVYTEAIDDTKRAGITINFQLVSEDTGLAKSERFIEIGAAKKATTDADGYAQIVLQRTDLLQPEGTIYRVTCLPLGLRNATLETTTATKNLADLIV